MSRIHEGLDDPGFPMPEGIEKTSICADTGLLPRAGCSVITEYFDIGSMPTDYCDQHFYEPEYDEEYYEDEDIQEELPTELTPTPDPNMGGEGTDPNTGGEGTDSNTGGEEWTDPNTGGEEWTDPNGEGDMTIYE